MGSTAIVGVFATPAHRRAKHLANGAHLALQAGRWKPASRAYPVQGLVASFYDAFTGPVTAPLCVGLV